MQTLALLLLLLIPITSPSAEAALENQVLNHPSPYLAMHGEDPVAWQTWGAGTLELARKLNRPLLVSIGYFSCHWCHVMQRESYRDPELAALLNQYFIPVKVDRELEPALDAHLIEFVQLTRKHAGWPLNVFLTPEGYPLVGMTYVPRDQFYNILERLHKLWQSDNETLRANAINFMQQWEKLRTPVPGEKAVSDSLTKKFRQQTQAMEDDLAGGFGQQNKFPMTPQLMALLWMREQTDDHSLDNFLKLTLDQMASQGMHDQLAGGFFRYTTDPSWRIPHYEKMLYDNAQLATLYLQAASQFDSQAYKDTGLETLDFILKHMQKADGSFLSSFSAVDDQGREGFFYLLSAADRQKYLNTDEQKAVAVAWFDSDAADTAYGSLPRWQASRIEIARQLDWNVARLNMTLASASRKLLKQRSSRSLPADDKSLAAWNGLMLSALSAGYASNKDARYLDAGRQLAGFLLDRLWNGKQLVRAIDGDKVVAAASLQDYALVAQGLWDWCQVAPGSECNQAVAQMVRHAWQKYYKDGLWVISDEPLIPMLEGKLALDDSPLPSATAVISRLSLLHPELKKDKQIQVLLQEHLQRVRASLADSILWYASYVQPVEIAQSLR